MHGLFCSLVLFIAVEIKLRREETAGVAFCVRLALVMGVYQLDTTRTLLLHHGRRLKRCDPTVVTFLTFLARIRLVMGED